MLSPSMSAQGTIFLDAVIRRSTVDVVKAQGNGWETLHDMKRVSPTRRYPQHVWNRHRSPGSSSLIILNKTDHVGDRR